ncbi:DUF1080 domain-containing protein [Akkermansiaceae bacterium]|nr:DUF1080 domain-containing protein [Akkermansiaceae bacterium]MDB4537795.1 DUF1080 domain-containing protein [Akkermansiaceae bacterium]
MMTKQLLVAALLATTPILFAQKNNWPKGIDPSTLLENKDAEPDLKTDGFTSLFNGDDLSGWTIKGGKMKFEARDGSIVGTCVPGQPNSFLCTDKSYADFVFTTEFKWEVPGNSGVMFRASTEKPNTKGFARVFGYQSEMDNSDRRWTGGIYGEAMGGWKYPFSKPKVHDAALAAVKNLKEWNRMTISAKGNVIKTWINGVPCSHLVNDERSEGFIGLQVHGGKEGRIHWRNISIQDLGGSETVDLFASGDFSAWAKTNGQPVPEGWSIKEGVVTRSKKGGDIATKEKYKDFELTFDWKISEGGNSGVKYRTRGSLGLEYQVLDDEKHSDNKNPTHRAGSVYELVAAPDEKNINPVGEWNSGRIVAKGNLLQHFLNGKKVAEIEYGSEVWNKQFQKSKYKKNEGFGSWTGPVLLQDHGNQVWFKNMRIKKL